jgi:hypothetical protein
VVTLITRSHADARQKARSERIESASSRTFNQNMGIVAPFMNNAG